jgi:hypothetical protein
MTDLSVKTETILALDLGTVHTRAFLFDVVEDHYQLMALGISPTTACAPFFDIGESVHLAISNLQQTVGRSLLNMQSGSLIIPVQDDGSGVDKLVLTISSGKSLRMVVAGLLPDISLDSVQKLATTTYARIVEGVGLTDGQAVDTRLDSIIRARPELVLIAGGIEKGASRSVFKIVDLIHLVCRLIPEGVRPIVIFSGNQSIAPRIKEALEKTTTVYTTTNIRPFIDQEDLDPAMNELAEIVGIIREHQIGGLGELRTLSDVPVLPTAYALGRITRYLSLVHDPKKYVLGLDVGASWTTVTAAKSGSPILNVSPYGMGAGIAELMQTCRLEDITQWLPIELQDSFVSDYLWQKILHPGSIPMTVETLAIEQALVRQILRTAIRQTLERWKFAPSFEPILASGAILGKSPKPLDSLLAILDGVQPVGISTVVLDQHNVLPSLGAISAVNSVLPVQVIDAGILLNLGTIISPVTEERDGRPILQVQMEYEDGTKSYHEVRQGTIVTLPLQPGEEARIQLEPIRRTQIDPYQRTGSNNFKIVGGECGVVIDGRGRPLILPTDASSRRETLQKWALAAASAK